MSLEENVRALIARIVERDKALKAWAHIDENGALLAARRCSGQPVRALTGWTLGVKDIIDVAGLPTTWGSDIYRDHVAVRDAACVALARAAGAIIIGKTVTTEFAHAAPSVTRNPWNPARTPGGSSSGSAAAVADGHVRVAFGTQTMGSVLRPASFCGVVGYKPTFGTISLEGVRSLAVSSDTLGWIARTIEDCRSFRNALLGIDVHAAAPHRPLRIALCRTVAWKRAEPAMQALAERAAAELHAGEVDLGFDDLDDVFFTIQAYEMCQSLAAERLEHHDRLSPQLRATLDTPGVDRAAYLAAKERVRRFDVDAAFGSADLLLMPAAPGEAPTPETTGDPVFNRPASLLGLPAIAIPGGHGPHGLPLGLQLVGRRWCDDDVFAGARALAAVLPVPESPPGG